jgi:hypothetical protein
MSQLVPDDAIAERPALAQPAESRWVPQQHRDRGERKSFAPVFLPLHRRASGFLNLSQSVVRPDRYREPSRFETLRLRYPSRPQRFEGAQCR